MAHSSTDCPQLDRAGVVGYGIDVDDLIALRCLRAQIDTPYVLTYEQRQQIAKSLDVLIDRIVGCPLIDSE